MVLLVQNDPEFDSIAASLLLVNSYNADAVTQSCCGTTIRRTRWWMPEGSSWMMSTNVPDHQDNMAINKILPNGARFYVDHAHPEFSTPECFQCPRSHPL